MSIWSDTPPPPSPQGEPPSTANAAPPSPSPGKPVRPGVLLGVGLLVLLGLALFATGAIVKVRAPKDDPSPKVLGIAAWQVATAGFVCTLAGGLWLRRLV